MNPGRRRVVLKPGPAASGPKKPGPASARTEPLPGGIGAFRPGPLVAEHQVVKKGVMFPPDAIHVYVDRGRCAVPSNLGLDANPRPRKLWNCFVEQILLSRSHFVTSHMAGPMLLPVPKVG